MPMKRAANIEPPTTTPPRRHEPAPYWDETIAVLLVANLLTLAQAYYVGADMAMLVAVYWVQNVILGVAHVFRILSFERFSLRGFKPDRFLNRAIKTPDGRRRVLVSMAILFSVHYGSMHIVYAVLRGWDMLKGAMFASDVFWTSVLLFAAHHLWSYRYHRERDRQSVPDAYLMMFLPYARVFPMHSMVMIGDYTANSPNDLLMFGILKTAADVMMHVIEHAQLRKTRPPRTTDVQQ